MNFTPNLLSLPYTWSKKVFSLSNENHNLTFHEQLWTTFSWAETSNTSGLYNYLFFEIQWIRVNYQWVSLYLNTFKNNTLTMGWRYIYVCMYIYILYIYIYYIYIYTHNHIYVYTYIYKLWKPRYYEAYFVFIILCFVVDIIIIIIVIIIILHTTCSALTNVCLANVIKVVNLYEYISTMSMVS